MCIRDSITIWRDYNPRAGCEGVIKQLDMDFALDKLCLKQFFATEAAMSLAVVAYNLCVLFQRHLGWMDRVTAATLRFRLFTTGGDHQQHGRTHHHPARRAAGAKGLVAKSLRETFKQIPQLQCNTLLPSMLRLKTPQKSTGFE